MVHAFGDGGPGGEGTVFIFLKSSWFEYTVHRNVRPEGKNYQVVLHDCYILK